MINRLKEKWEGLTSERKKAVAVSGIIGVIIILSVISYYFTRADDASKPTNTANTKKEINLEPKLLEKTYVAESTKQIEEMKQEMESLKKQLEEEKKTKEAGKAMQEGKQKDDPTLMPPIPPPPPPPYSTQIPPAQAQNAKPAPVIETIGDIEVVSYQPKVQEKTNEQEDKKKVENKVYLPPSFMEATLLSGLDAPTTGEGKNHPVPVLLRVKDIAVLPNKVKANLKGCFVIADGTGSLADERAHLRLVSLSCLTKNGEAIIDQEVKGFVVDSDGKIGLRGTVVSKMGSAIARSFIAGFFGGVGSSLSNTQMLTTVSPLGVTQTPKTDLEDVTIAGVGQGISTASAEIQKFYLELAKQAIPVIEVGASKNVTLVISKGTYLEIKDYKGIGGK